MSDQERLRSGLRLSTGREYGGGYSDEEVATFSEEDGRSSFHDAGIWGENTELRVVHALHHAVDAQTGLVEAAYTSEATALEEELHAVLPAVRYAEEEALEDIEEEGYAREEAARVEGAAKRHGLALPRPGETLRYVGKLAGLVLGDLAFIAVAFQIFGLSDGLALGLIPFSSELHVAALSSVLSLLVLSHYASADLVTLRYERRVAGAPDRPAALAQLTEYLRPVAWLIGGVLVLLGVAAVRELYLAERGVEAHTWVFVSIQAGIFLAALALGTAHAHPLAREWGRASKRVAAAAAAAEASATHHASLVAKANAVESELRALPALAVKHIRIAEADTRRQIQLYLRGVQLNQPEPVTEALFPKRLPERKTPSASQLLRALTGDKGLRNAEPLTVNRVVDSRNRMRESR